MSFGGIFGQAFVPLPVNEWWLAGGISIDNCVAIYQPKGAEDYAKSKENIINPGTYDAIDLAAYPTWDATNGWKFNGTTQGLIAGNLVVLKTWSVFIQFTNQTDTANTHDMFGQWTASQDNFIITATRGAGGHGYMNGSGEINLGSIITAGNMGIAGTKCYLNGSLDTTITGQGGTNTTKCYIGRNNNGSYNAVYIQALAIYDTAITAEQAGSLAAAMAAL